MKLKLNEDAFEDVLPGPETGNDYGVADLLMNLIKGELDTIQNYNSFLATIKPIKGFDNMIDTIEHINDEENKHIGELQALLKTISPNVERIEKGQDEAEKEMDAAEDSLQ